MNWTQIVNPLFIGLRKESKLSLTQNCSQILPPLLPLFHSVSCFSVTFTGSNALILIQLAQLSFVSHLILVNRVKYFPTYALSFTVIQRLFFIWGSQFPTLLLKPRMQTNITSTYRREFIRKLNDYFTVNEGSWMHLRAVRKLRYPNELFSYQFTQLFVKWGTKFPFLMRRLPSMYDFYEWLDYLPALECLRRDSSFNSGLTGKIIFAAMSCYDYVSSIVGALLIADVSKTMRHLKKWEM